MAKKHIKISQVILAVLAFLTLSFASAYRPAFACGEDESDVTNCVEERTSEDSEEESEDEGSDDYYGGESLISAIEKDSIDDEYFSSGGVLNESRSLNHSAFLAGNEVSSEDDIDGIALLAGNLVNFKGWAEHAFIAGNSVNISGTTSSDVFVAGNAIEITDSASIGRDLFAVGDTVLLKTNLYGNAYLAGTRLVLENVTINGNLKVDFDEIVIKGKSSVSGDFRYNNTAKVTGLENLTTETSGTYESSPSSSTSVLSKIESKIISLLGRLLVTIILLALTPKFSKNLIEKFELKSSWKELGIGLLALMLVPVAALFVMITVVGIPFGIIALIIYGLMIYLSTSVTGGVVGELVAKNLLKKKNLHIFLKYTIGIVIVAILKLIPVVGGLVGAVSLCFGFGYLAKLIFAPKKKSA